jgi:hypothetical protein
MIVSITEDGHRHFKNMGFTIDSAGGRGTMFVTDWQFSSNPELYYEEYKLVVDGHEYTFVGYFSYNQSVKMIDSVNVFNTAYEKVATIVDVFVPVGTKPPDIRNDQFYLSGVDERVIDGGGSDYADLGAGNDVYIYGSGYDKIYGGEGYDLVEAAGFRQAGISIAAVGDDWYDIRSGSTLILSTKYVELIAFGGLAAHIDNGQVRWEAANELIAAISTSATIDTTLIFTGQAPAAQRMADLTLFADSQYRAYAAAGVMNPTLGPFEAFGKAYASDPTTRGMFASEYGSLSEDAFLDKGYAAVFGVAPSADARQALSGQIAYFRDLYVGAGIEPGAAALEARGAVLGQIIGHGYVTPASEWPGPQVALAGIGLDASGLFG